MANNTIDAALVQKMFLAGAKNLESKKEWINDLNVFPVPDGDTGTNMTLTIMSAAKEVSSIANPNMENLSKAISSGSLRGARGNSGVILSQLLRGFTKEMKGVTEITVETLALATSRATETALLKMLDMYFLRHLICFLSLKKRELWIQADRDLLLFLRECMMHLQERLQIFL